MQVVMLDFKNWVWQAANVMGVINDTHIFIVKPFNFYYQKYLFHEMEKGGDR
jgi:hypothetical protein